MENYDTEFRTTTQPGDILVAGFNFGCGSSREQAATAILAKQIPLVVAGSFGGIFGRNAVGAQYDEHEIVLDAEARRCGAGATA